jgi:FixJ family two-component response regulator
MGTSKPPLLVAVVEDDAPSRQALGRLLQAGGFEPALFESAEAFIAAAPAPLCIVVDVRLPGMSGIELQQRLRADAESSPQG